uniref:Uncharacterized protein n=1 Tax=Megaviridae environmental sample TaxID=1737588 RepID=A0A5J6VI28_9VIRU|nr:MAG: hypothetical protein [Megaviridae environmental sample]
MSVVCPYFSIDLVSRVYLKPHQLDNNLKYNILSNIRRDRENKCCKHGYIIKVHDDNDIDSNISIVNDMNGLVRPEDMQCTAEFMVRFSANMCMPIENTQIVVKIDRLQQVLLFASNGPIKVLIQLDDINHEKFELTNERIFYKDTETFVEEDEFVIVQIMAQKFYTGDNEIKTIGRLIDRATQSDKDLSYRLLDVKHTQTYKRYF